MCNHIIYMYKNEEEKKKKLWWVAIAKNRIATNTKGFFFFLVYCLHAAVSSLPSVLKVSESNIYGHWKWMNFVCDEYDMQCNDFNRHGITAVYLFSPMGPLYTRVDGTARTHQWNGGLHSANVAVYQQLEKWHQHYIIVRFGLAGQCAHNNLTIIIIIIYGYSNYDYFGGASKFNI